MHGLRRRSLRPTLTLALIIAAVPPVALAAVVNVRGTAGNDVITINLKGQDTAQVTLNGEAAGSASAGDTVQVRTGPGRDRIFDEVEDFELNVRASLGAGNDTARIRAPRAQLITGIGVDTLCCDIARLVGGEGDDTFHTRGGNLSRIICGPGKDTVVLDAKDVASKDCEIVRRP